MFTFTATKCKEPLRQKKKTVVNEYVIIVKT